MYWQLLLRKNKLTIDLYLGFSNNKTFLFKFYIIIKGNKFYLFFESNNSLQLCICIFLNVGIFIICCIRAFGIYLCEKYLSINYFEIWNISRVDDQTNIILKSKSVRGKCRQAFFFRVLLFFDFLFWQHILKFVLIKEFDGWMNSFLVDN